ncbi:ELO domain containing protein, partial [Asbolus verrucosus]
MAILSSLFHRLSDCQIVNFLTKKYDHIVNDLGGEYVNKINISTLGKPFADPRVKDWIGFSSPNMTLAIIAVYLLSIYVLLPAFMKNRKPYRLKIVLFCYNIFQIFSCAALIYGILTSGWLTTYSWGCQPVDYSDNPEALRMLTFCHFEYVLKGIELLETVMFVLRKKYNQVSNLHVYHHCSTFFLKWIVVKYVGGGMVSFPAIINSFVHILMYSYYLLTSLGEEWQTKLAKWKPKLTMLQMIQFCVIIAHPMQALHPDCHVQKQLLLIYVPNVLLVFYMFWKFYKKSYMKK